MAHRLVPEAEAEIDDIWLYIAKESGSMDIADRLVDSIADRFYLLARNPFIGRSRDKDSRPGLRSFPVGEYVIIYRIEDDGVLILHILHGKRNILAFFGQLRLQTSRSGRRGARRNVKIRGAFVYTSATERQLLRLFVFLQSIPTRQ